MAEIAFYIFSSILLLSSTMVIFSRNPVHSVLFLIVTFFNAAGLFILLGAEFLAMLLVIVYVGAVAVLFLFIVMMLDIAPPSSQASQFWPKAVIVSYAFLSFLVHLSLFCGLTILFLKLAHINIKDLKNYSVDLTLQNVKIMGAILLSHFVLKLGIKKSLWKKGKHFFQVLPYTWILGFIVMAELSYMISRWQDLPFSSLTSLKVSSKSLMSSNTHALGRILYTNYVFLLQISGLILLQAMIGAILLTHRKREGIKRQNSREQIARRKEDTLELHDVPIGKGI